MDNNRILIVDDEKLILWSLASTLSKEGYHVCTAESGREALRAINDFDPAVVMLDILLPDISGLELLKRFKAANSGIHVIMLTAYANADSAVQALKDGAEDYFGKPFCMDAVSQAVARALQKRRGKSEARIFRKEQRRKAGRGKLIGNSRRMIEVFKLIKVCADADVKTVLVTGESGTGKELVAQAIHYNSARARAPFIEVNCASIPENLLENELFGHERGAYTDAGGRGKGVFEMAQGGTLFLDEIGDMPYAMQAKVLKVIETRRFRRLGGTEDVEADVRIITATHQNLPEMVRDGRFRSDLIFRLNVMNIKLPPLRDRMEDIPALVQYFIEALNDEYGRGVECASAETLSALEAHHWPGNVRELRNCIERMMMLEEGTVLSPGHLCLEVVDGSPPSRGDADSSADFSGEHIILPHSGMSLEELEKQLIVLALKKSHGNQSKAARFLRTSRDTLRYRMQKFGLGDAADPLQPQRGEDAAARLLSSPL